MSTIAEAAPTATSRHFVYRRIHSLVGIVPIGTFLIYHFWFHAHSWQGATLYDQRLAGLYASPFKDVFAWITVYLPLIYHSIYGLFITRDMGPNFLAYGWFRNWMYTLQRASGIGLLLFIPAHLVKARFASVFFPGETMSFHHMSEGLVHPLTFSVYVAGVLGAAFHLANGLFTFGITWGLWTGVRAQRRAATCSVIFFLLLAGMGFWAMAGFFQK